MVRVKRGTIAHKRRKKALRLTKGFRWGRKTKYRLAKEALFKAWTYAFRDRRAKKRAFRRLWETRLNAALKPFGLPYGRFIHLLKKQRIQLDRKILAILAAQKPETFKRVVERATSAG